MSVVLYKIEYNRLYLSSDGILISGGYKSICKNKLCHIRDNVFLGAVGIIDTITYIQEYLKKYELPNEINVLTLREYFGNITKEYSNCTSESAKFNVEAILVIGKEIYRVIINSDYDCKLELHKCESSIDGVGWFEMPFGAMLTGIKPTEAIELSIPYCNNINYPIHEYVFDLDKNEIIKENYIFKD